MKHGVQIWALCAVLFLGCFSAAAAQDGGTRPAAQAEAAGNIAYRLDSGDKVQITTFGEASLTGPFEVSGAGMIAFPLIGEVRAKGLTTVELGKAIEAALKDGYLKNPDVSVGVMNYRPFYILGEVNKPGEYPYTNGLTVLNAVATANGFTYRANTHIVLVKRAADSAEHDVELGPNTPVQPGDTIRVKERFF